MDRNAELGISKVLIERFEHDRLPRILKIKEHVDQGHVLEETQIMFLQQVLEDAQKNQGFVDSIPECRVLFAKVIHLYHEITAKALGNESKLG
jgi:outer membrane protein assembly factor BamA